MINNAESILVIILSITLTIYLIVSIVVMVFFAKLIQSLRRTAEHAEQVVETAGEAAEMLRNVSGPLAFFKVIRNLMRSYDKMHKK